MSFSHNHGRDSARRGALRPLYESADGFGQKPDYKTAALCKHARRSIALSLAGECGDELLQSLIVDEVLPAPNASRLLVRLILRSADPAVITIHIHERLAKVHGLLRAKLGESIARKRTPDLTFDVILLRPQGNFLTTQEGGAS